MALTFDVLQKTSLYNPAFKIMAKNVEATNILTEGQLSWLHEVTKTFELRRVLDGVHLLQANRDSEVDFSTLLYVRNTLNDLYSSLKFPGEVKLAELIRTVVEGEDFWEGYYRLILFLRANHVNLSKFPAICNAVTAAEERACDLRASAAKSTKMLTAFGVFADSAFVKIRVSILHDFICGEPLDTDCWKEYTKKFEKRAKELESWGKWLYTEVSLQDVLDAFMLEPENVQLFSQTVKEQMILQILDMLSVLGDESIKYRYFTQVILSNSEQAVEKNSALSFETFKSVLQECNEDVAGFVEQFAVLQEARKGVLNVDTEAFAQS